MMIILASLAETEKPFHTIIIDGKKSTEEELQNFYRTAKTFQARNENKVLIVETDITQLKESSDAKKFTFKSKSD